MLVASPPPSCKVYTPDKLARAMVYTLQDIPGAMWLEPSVGQGVFLGALHSVGVPPNRIIAIDLDSHPGSGDQLAQTLRPTDFLRWSQITTMRFDRIIGNPPYVSVNKLVRSSQQAALSVKGPSGEGITLGANCWYAFLCASLSVLREGGAICLVLPAAWEYADYAEGVRGRIGSYFSQLSIHRCGQPMFDGVQDGCLVMIARGFRQPGNRTERFEHSNLDALVAKLREPEPKPDPRLYLGGISLQRPIQILNRPDTCRLRDVLEIRLGGVTGDNDYFLMNEAFRRERKLPTASVVPVLSRARHLVSGRLTIREWMILRDNGERVWLFRPPDALLSHPAVRAYIALASESEHGCRKRYKVKTRHPWHRTSLPRGIDGFVSGMSTSGPWICFKGMSRLSATNTLYTIRFLKETDDNTKAAWALSLLTTEVQRTLQSIRRVYPARLFKHEPTSLMNIRVPVPKRVNGAMKQYLAATRAHLSGDVTICQQLADIWFLRPDISTLWCPVRIPSQAYSTSHRSSE